MLATACASTSPTKQVTGDSGLESAPTSGPAEPPVGSEEGVPLTSLSDSEQSTSGLSSTTVAPSTTRRPTTTTTTTTTTVPVTTTLYDPREYFEVTFDFVDYICEDRSFWEDNQYDCVRYYGGLAPIIFSPDLYCSGPDYGLSCSTTWYPDELDGYEFINFGGREYVCRDAYAWTASRGDKDCFRYRGGDPFHSISGIVDLYCSGSGSYLTCDTDDYPSVWEDYVVLRIEWSQYICDKGAFGDMPCVRYYGGGPSQYSFWNPDYYCDRFSNYCEAA